MSDELACLRIFSSCHIQLLQSIDTDYWHCCTKAAIVAVFVLVSVRRVAPVSLLCGLIATLRTLFGPMTYRYQTVMTSYWFMQLQTAVRKVAWMGVACLHDPASAPRRSFGLLGVTPVDTLVPRWPKTFPNTGHRKGVSREWSLDTFRTGLSCFHRTSQFMSSWIPENYCRSTGA
jgi:hypothetical protein